MSDCRRFPTLLRLRDEGEHAAVEAHLASCPACAAEWADLEALTALGRALPEGQPSPDRRESVRTTLLARAAAPAPAPRARWAGVAAAAVVLIAAGLMLRPSTPESLARISSARGTIYSVSRTVDDEVVELVDGEITIDVGHLSPGQRFRVLTEDAEVEVRGTAFTVRARQGVLAAVEVQSGVVEVRPRGESPVRLGATERWARPDGSGGDGAEGRGIRRVAPPPVGGEPPGRPDGSAAAGAEAPPGRVDAVEPSDPIAAAEGTPAGDAIVADDAIARGERSQPVGAARRAVDPRSAPAGTMPAARPADPRRPATPDASPDPRHPATPDASPDPRRPATPGAPPDVARPVEPAPPTGGPPPPVAPARTPSGASVAPRAAETRVAAPAPPDAMPSEPSPTDPSAADEPAAHAPTPQTERFDAGWRALRSGEARAAAEAFGEAARLEGPLRADARWWQVVALGRAGDDRVARRAARRFLADHPDSPRQAEASVMLGWLAFAEGEVDAAEAYFRAGRAARRSAVRARAEEGLEAVEKWRRQRR